MSIGRRGFLSFIAAGSATCVVGCDGGAEPLDGGAPDGGAERMCGQPEPASPPALDYPDAAYFDQVSADLDAAGRGTPVVFLDMDRVDANIDAIASGVLPHRYRIVVKSLPSLELLEYVSRRAETESFLVLHLPFLAEILSTFPSGDVLMGKTHTATAVRSFFAGLPVGTDLAATAARVVFLADSSTRLAELSAVAATYGVSMRVAIELDVGLERSGVSEPDELRAMLSMLEGATELGFEGFLGYDGHVAYVPVPDTAWSEATATFQAFVDILSAEFASLVRPDLVFHSGGSATYPMYSGGGTPVNDVAAGGGVLRPGGYPDHVIGDLSPAIFIATPVLRTYETPGLPFFAEEWEACAFEGLQGLTIYGGGWPAFFTHPPHIRPAPIVSDPTDVSLVPNQGLVTAPAELAIEPGDWVFFHPRQADALFQFERIHLLRGGRLQAETMAAFPRRY